MALYYTLRMFKGKDEVVTSTVANVPCAENRPRVGQTIDGKWEVTEILKSSEEELHVRVEPIDGKKGE